MFKEFDEVPGIVTSDPDSAEPFDKLLRRRERKLERAYKLGLLHGINAQSMAQAKNDVMEFDDYGWEV